MTLGPWGQREPMEMYCFLSWEWWGLCLCPRNFAFSPRLINSHSPMWKSNSRSDSVLCSWGFNPASEFRIQLSLNHLELCLPRSLSLSAYYLAVILSALICSRRKHLWWSPNKALMYEYSRVSLGFILLLLFFLKTSIYQWCLEYLVSSSWSRNLCLVSVPSHRVNFKSLVGYSFNYFATIIIINQRFLWLGWCLFLFWEPTEYLRKLMTLEHRGDSSLQAPPQLLHVQGVVGVLSSARGPCWSFVDSNL